MKFEITLETSDLSAAAMLLRMVGDAFGLAGGHVVMGLSVVVMPYHCPFGHLEYDEFPGCRPQMSRLRPGSA